MTEWWAFKPVTTAFDKTRKLLLEPFNAWAWLKLMIIVFFVGTGTSRISNNFSNLANYRTGPSDTYAIEQGINSILSNTMLIMVIVGLAILVIALALLFAYLRNVFSFVFIQALTTGDVHIIKPIMDNLGRGFRLFVFTLLVGLLTLGVVVGAVITVILGIILVIKIGVSGILGLIVLMLAIFVIVILLLLLIAFSIASAIFVGFTYDFVAPMVYFKGMGIVEAWIWLWASIKKDWQQYGVYVIARWALELGVGILTMFIVLPVALIFIAILLAGAIAAALAAQVSIVLAVIVGLALLVLAAIFVLAMMAISMPVAVYFRYYSLDVLKLIDPSAVIYSGRFTPPPPPPSMLPA
jgi:hypothetical protein